MTRASSSRPSSRSAAAPATREQRRDPGIPLWAHPGWEARFPWLVQGTTGRGDGAEPFDLGLSGAQPVGAVLERWRRVNDAAGMRTVVHARQVHGADLCVHTLRPAPGLLVMSGVDGHLTAQPGLLLSVSVADCVPVFLVSAERRAVALVHAGWRGVAGGILERAVQRLDEAYAAPASLLWLHCGPSICGECYTVGAEVHAAVAPGRPAPATPAPIDLGAALVERAVAAGLDVARCSVSDHCTRCGIEGGHARPFFSHRAGESARQMALLGVRA